MNASCLFEGANRKATAKSTVIKLYKHTVGWVCKRILEYNTMPRQDLLKGGPVLTSTKKYSKDKCCKRHA